MKLMKRSVYSVGGTRLEDIDLLRNDEAWVDALQAEIIPDSTTAGDFLRHFGSDGGKKQYPATNMERITRKF